MRMSSQKIIGIKREKVGQNLTRITFLKVVYDFLTVDGDSIRTIVQKPIVLRWLDQGLGTCLDCGCGRGLYTRFLVQRASRVYALEARKDCLKLTRQATRGHDNIELILGRAESLPFKDKCFDTVVCTEVMEHIDNDEKAMAEVARVAKEGARLILSVPVPPGVVDNKNKEPLGHKREGYTLSKICILLNQNGFTIRRYKYCFFRFSRFVLNLMAKYVRLFKLRPPFFILLPIFFDGLYYKNENKAQPFDIVVEAVKHSQSS